MVETIDRQTWDKALAHLQRTLDEESYSTWLEPTKFHESHDNRITLSVPDTFCKNWINSNYREKIVGALRSVTSQDIDLDFLVRGSGDAEIPRATDLIGPGDIQAEWGNVPTEATASGAMDFPKFSGLNPKYSFDHFVVGESNRFAHAACRQVADPMSKSYNPLFIYGGVGLGKTHLMHAIGHFMLTVNDGLRVLYLTSEQFMNSFIESISQGKQFEFREYYRNVDLLMIDDVQFFSGKERTQTEFFHTFNALYDAGKKIVVSSDRPPKELTTLEDRLRNRFSWGLVVDIMPPDLETRIAILRKKALLDATDLPNEVAVYMAERVQSNIRELEGVLMRLKAYSVLQKEPINLQLAQDVLGHLLERTARADVEIDEIIETVCGYFELRRADLLGASRLKKFASPRHIAQYICRKLTSHSYPEIAAKFGGRDHTSVLHAVKKIEDGMASDDNLRNLVAYLSKKVSGARQSV